MIHTDDALRARTPIASSTLLTAALSGLLCLATSCTPSNEPPPTNASTSPDASAPTDASAPSDVTGPADVTAPTDASAPSDAAPTADTSAATDVAATDVAPTTDASATSDVSATSDAAPSSDAGSNVDAAVVDASADVRDVPCDYADVRFVTSSDAATGMTLVTFTAMCDRVGGFVEVHPHCGGANSCGGFSYDSDSNTFTEHTCAGLNTCTGYSCVIP